MTASDRHDRLVREVVSKLVDSTETEADMLVALESVTLGVAILHRWPLRRASEFLDLMTQRVIERIAE